MSDTPRTDAFLKENHVNRGILALLIEFTKSSERENTKLRAVMKELAEALEQHKFNYMISSVSSGADAALTYYHEAIKE